jgi:hypothetical protein
MSKKEETQIQLVSHRALQDLDRSAKNRSPGTPGGAALISSRGTERSKFLIKGTTKYHPETSLDNTLMEGSITKNFRGGESRDRSGVNLDKLKEKRWRRKLASNRKSLESGNVW